MRVLLRNARIGLYYVGPRHWVGSAEAATDLQTIERAAELSRDEKFEEMEVVVLYGDPVCDFVLPLGTRKPRVKQPALSRA